MSGEEVDLTGVDPKRRDETRRRVRLLKAYLELEHRSTSDADRFAAELGVGRNQFQVLVRAWVLHGRASALPGAVGRIDVARGAGPRFLDDRVERLVGEAIARSDEGDSIATIGRAIVAACAVEGLEAPSVSTMRYRVLAARARERPTGAPTNEIVVGRGATGVPVVLPDGTLERTVLALAVNAGSTEVVAWEMGHGLVPPSICALLVRLIGLGATGAPPARVLVDLGAGGERDALHAAVRAAGLAGAILFGAEDVRVPQVPTLLRGRMGPMRVTEFRRRAGPRKAAVPNARSRPLAVEEAAAYVAEIASARNAELRAAVGAPPAFRLGDGMAALVLDRAFGNLSGWPPPPA